MFGKWGVAVRAVQAVLRVEASGLGDQELGNVDVDAPITRCVGVRHERSVWLRDFRRTYVDTAPAGIRFEKTTEPAVGNDGPKDK